MKKYRAGNTLVELAIYVGLLSLLLVIMTQLFSSVINAHLESAATSSVETDSKYLFARLHYDIERATNITTPAVNGTSSQIVAVIAGTTYTYSLVGGNLQLSDGTNADILNGYDTTVSNLSATLMRNSLNEDYLRVSYTVSSRTLRNGAAEVKNVQTTIGRR